MDLQTSAHRSRPAKPWIIANLVIYQAVWLACVWGAARAIPALGCAAAMAAVAWHLCKVERPLSELKLVLLTGLLGGTWDSLLVIFDLIDSIIPPGR